MVVDNTFDTTEDKALEKEKQPLEQAIVQLMTEHKLTLSAAESCTGGMFSARVINTAGASAVYEAGFVTYANKAKHKLIGVKKKTLKEYVERMKCGKETYQKYRKRFQNKKIEIIHSNSLIA